MSGPHNNRNNKNNGNGNGNGNDKKPVDELAKRMNTFSVNAPTFTPSAAAPANNSAGTPPVPVPAKAAAAGAWGNGPPRPAAPPNNAGNIMPARTPMGQLGRNPTAAPSGPARQMAPPPQPRGPPPPQISTPQAGLAPQANPPQLAAPAQQSPQAGPAPATSSTQQPLASAASRACSSKTAEDSSIETVDYDGAFNSGPFQAPDMALGKTRVDDLANGLAMEHNLTADRAKAQFGLRTSSSQKLTTTPKKVLTNHLRLNPPEKLYVYDLHIVREYDRNTNAQIDVKKAEDREQIFDDLLLPPVTPATPVFPASMKNDPDCWATDYRMVWSTKLLFGVDPNTQQPNNLLIPGTTYQNYCGVQLPFAEVRLDFRGDIRCHLPTAALFGRADDTPDRTSTSSLLLRGLNAFLTKHARATAAQQGHTFTSANKAFVHSTSFNIDSAGGLRSLRGFFLSARPGTEFVYLNLNPVNSAFFQQKTTVGRFMQAQGYGARQATRALKNIKLFDLQAGAHKYLIKVEVNQQTRRMQVLVDTNTLQNPLPGSTTRVYIPADMAQIVEYQRFNGTLSSDQTSLMVGQARRDPQRNMNLILTDAVHMFGFGSNPNQPINVRPQLMQIAGNWLNPPRIQYGGAQINPRQASWNLAAAGKFSTAVPATNLYLLNLTSYGWADTSDIRTMLEQQLLAHGLRAAGTTFVQLPRTVNISQIPRDAAGSLDTLGYENNIGRVLSQIPVAVRSQAHLLVLIQQSSQDVYAYVKRIAELALGIKTIFCVKKGRPNPQLGSNIALKFNLKNAGTNHHLASTAFTALRPKGSTSAADTIVIGADVTHPGLSSSDGTPSIAAVVGTTDDNFMRFPGSMRLQRSRKEEIVELGDMVKERLIDWAMQHGKRLPKRMLFYRDGVSESQYAEMRRYEIPQIQKAFNWAQDFLNKSQGNAQFRYTNAPEWPETKMPAGTKKGEAEEELVDRTGLKVDFELTYVVVGKRHNTRFYPVGKDNSNTRSGNVQPGLVVDSTITHPTSLDFYLQSHDPIIGTGRSAHYFVLQNGMNLSTIDLQNVTHAFCYAYAVATKGVSYCAPAYYADRLCDRGRAYLRHWLTHNTTAPRQVGQDVNQPNETYKEFNKYVKDSLRDLARLRVTPNANNTFGFKYGVPRRNPWHPNMDNIMFYL